VYPSVDDLGPSAIRLMEVAGAIDFHHRVEWYRTLTSQAVDPADEVRFHVLEDAGSGEALALLPLLRPRGRVAPGQARTALSLTTYYSSLYAPILAPGHDEAVLLERLFQSVCAGSPTWDVMRLSPLAADAPTFSLLVEALRRQGMFVQTYFCFGNWYLDVAGQSFDQYLAARPSVLRNTLTRKSKKLKSSGRAKVRMVTGGDELAEAIADYQRVYDKSWKVPEPWPGFMAGLITAFAAVGSLRLGLVHVDGEPAAAQVWIVNGSTASIYKLAYDEKFSDLSVGTVLTAHLMQHAIDVDKVSTVDYLTGDDPYKKDWMSHRRERWGILALNRRTINGMAGIVRHAGGRLVKGLLSRARGQAASSAPRPGG
jgi:ribosomal protein S18 acetylase RimI-like enzyme